MTDSAPLHSTEFSHEFTYDAFISYSTTADKDLAAKLQHHIERIGLPAYRRRRLRVFRDFTNLSADADAGRVIQHALARSRRFILLVSPEARRSKWVGREVEWWRDNRSADDMFLVLTAGTIRWDDTLRDWNWTEGTPLPEALRGMHPVEPLWVDLSARTTGGPRRTRKEREQARMDLLNACATIAAPLRSMDKDALYGAHIVQLRRARQRLIGGTALLSVLLVLAVIATFVARDRTRAAEEQARIASARSLAAASVAGHDDHLDLAQLLAVEAYRLDRSPESRSALLETVTAQPHLVRYLQAGATVTQVLGSENGEKVVAGTAKGEVLSWTGPQRRKRTLGRLDRGITDLALSADGTIAAACDDTRAMVWAGGRAGRRIAVPTGEKADLVAVSPSGRWVAVHSTSADLDMGSLTLLDLQSGRVTHTASAGSWSVLALPSEEEAILFDSAYGTWERRTFPALSRLGGDSIEFGVHNSASALSSDGSVFTYSNGDTWLPVWESQETAQELNKAPLEADSAGPRPTAVALSSNGSYAATAANGVIHVSQVGPTGADRPPMTELRGNAEVNQDALAFIDDGDRLVSATGSLVTEWDLKRLSRIGVRANAQVPVTCGACAESWLTISPDGRNAAITGGLANEVWLHPLTSPTTTGRAGEAGLSKAYTEGPALWDHDAEKLYFMSFEKGSLQIYDRTTGTLSHSLWDTGAADTALPLSVSADSRKLLAVIGNAIVVRDIPGRRTISRVELGTEAASGELSAARQVAVNSSWTKAAVVAKNRVLLIDLVTGKASRLRGTSSAVGVMYGGELLAIAKKDGSTVLYGPRGSRPERTIPRDPTTAWRPFALNSQGTLLAQQRLDGSVLLTDPQDGRRLGALALSPPYSGSKTSLRFTDDGKKLVVALEDQGTDEAPGIIQQWDTTPDAWIAEACRTAGRDLSAAEWERYVGTPAPDDLRCERSWTEAD
ncbi:TIR domain-containing protein [Streptomyces sp. NBC_00878]|uniref:TIR domain-containing protein n=1 Tax=Streptomyces sp. NBC_00878 TaxID=2975854 RepID=UPI00224D12AF|nr:TIR domain-containing protein [Streptomyces sp. NBC_00878]MCX4905727.1 TIR domain-containing protein [Streptomyces sp. NBC_00878]